jgi:hypothetical protein
MGDCAAERREEQESDEGKKKKKRKRNALRLQPDWIFGVLKLEEKKRERKGCKAEIVKPS